MPNWWTNFYRSLTTENDEDIIGELQKISATNIYDRDENNLLHYVAQTSRTTIAEHLISLGCNVNHKNNLGSPPILEAIKNNRIDMVQLFISKGAVLSTNHYVNEKGPLHFAASLGFYDLYKMLLKAGCDTKADSNGYSLLHYASLSNSDSNRTEFIETLIKDGFDVNAKSNDGITPLHYVSAYGCSKYGSNVIIDMLLRAGADLEAKVTGGTTPLFWAVIHGKSDTALQLLKAGAKFNELDPSGKSCLHYAIQNLNFKIVKLLLDHGASTDELDADNVSPLWQCLRNCCVMLNQSREQYDLCHEVIEKKYSLEQVNSQVKCISLLLEYGEDVNSKGINNQLRTSIAPIYAAMLFNHYKVVRLLLNNGATFDYLHKYGKIVLKRLGSQDSKSIHELLKHTAEYEEPNRNGGPLNFDPELLKKSLQKYYTRCKSELGLMKKTLIFRELSYFHVLLRLNIEFYIKNEQVKNAIDAVNTKKPFPIFFELLAERFHEEEERLQLVKESLRHISRFSKRAESCVNIVFSNVCRYLDKKDLRKLVKI